MPKRQVEGVKRQEIPGVKAVSHGDVMYRVVAIVNNTVLHKRVNLTSSQHKKNISLLCMVMMVARLTVVIVLQCIQILSHLLYTETNVIYQLYLSEGISISFYLDGQN